MTDKEKTRKLKHAILDAVSRQGNEWLDNNEKQRKAIKAIKRWNLMPIEDVFMEIAIGMHYIGIRADKE